MAMRTRRLWNFVLDALLLACLLASVYVATAASASPRHPNDDGDVRRAAGTHVVFRWDQDS